ncbi:hypothetical protein NliqN6_5012 [Naganishia liquefaciens]|uniref:SMP-30/Gluconolactonase/LRE-like region domain-containing protein n=1 Tax=Naganishia liquefaciens TaxID=104408 RepID=A0A8H3TWP6_9TREE|nr:hypothetical protein NliqN6_5012 [Naganishia liquefaciens]
MPAKQITLEEPYIACQNQLGEGCLWDPKTGLLHWVDIKRSQIHTVEPKTGYRSIDDYSDVDEMITSLVLRSDKPGFIGTHTTHLAEFPEATKPTTANPSPIKRTSTPLVGDKSFTIPEKYTKDKEDGTDRFNDGACDALGRFWVGTMGVQPGNRKGQFYRYDVDGKVTTVKEDVGCSNGIGWSPDTKIMYYIDSPRTTILAYDFDLQSGTISNERIFATSDAFDGGVFDGLCMDAEGAVWAARWGSCRVVRYLPDGTLDTEIITPKALNVTCCIFGGDDMQDLYITTASCGETDKSLIPQYPQGGDLFRVRIDGVKGVERFKFAA